MSIPPSVSPANLALHARDPQRALRRVELELARRAVLHERPAFAAVRLTDPDGVVWELTVDSAGALQTAKVRGP
jgi:hypothetical protein